jgi:hypothetical protein
MVGEFKGSEFQTEPVPVVYSTMDGITCIVNELTADERSAGV